MKKLLGLGKVLTALFWGAALANLLHPFAQPFAFLLYLTGALLMLVHGLELWLFDERLRGCPRPRLERLQVALFGVFHLLYLPPAQASELAQGEVQLEAEHA